MTLWPSLGGLLNGAACYLVAGLAAVLAAQTAVPGPAAAETDPVTCNIRYNLPGDIRGNIPFARPDSDRASRIVNKYGWRTFLALNAEAVGKTVSRTGDNRTQWENWSSSESLIQCARDLKNCVCDSADCLSGRVEHYPAECQAIEGFRDYRVLGQISKIDDSFLQATIRQLSNTPLIDANGKFVRFEIMVSPATQDYVVKNRFYDAEVLANLTKNLRFPCGREAYTGGDPASKKSGSFVVKNAWMEVPADSIGFGLENRYLRDYHTEELLVYTPSYRNRSGVATCEKKTMALVGQHITHKTLKQSRWTWSTFEHKNNAPDCTALPPPGNKVGSGPSVACPKKTTADYNFYPQACSKNGTDPDACQSCNATPVSNRRGCINPAVAGDISWCLDRPPAKVAGTSRLCRQIPTRHYKTGRLNKACAQALGRDSVWSNYEQIATQWYATKDTSCITSTTVDFTEQRPLVPVSGPAVGPKTPYLANTSMESAIRANCLGCHRGGRVGPKDTISTDFMYWIQVEAAGLSEAAHGLADIAGRSPH